jgi:hypothetical protein
MIMVMIIDNGNGNDEQPEEPEEPPTDFPTLPLG